MAVFCFTCPDCGTQMTVDGSVHRPPQRRGCKCGATAVRDIAAEQSGRPSLDRVDHWRGHSSRAMGVLPKQVAELREQVEPHGVRVNSDGSIVTDSPGAQKHAMKVLGKMRTGTGYAYL